MRAVVAVEQLEWTNNSSSSWGGEHSDIPRDAVLHGSVQIGTAMFHVQAMAVVDRDGDQSAVDPMYQQDVEHVLDLCGDCPLETLKIPNHEHDYVVVIYPFAT